MINSLISAIMGLFAVSCNHLVPMYGVVAMYGVPTKLVDVKGKITNESGEALKGVQVKISTAKEEGVQYEVYTNDEGLYTTVDCDFFNYGNDTLKVVVNDTTDVYAPDSVKIPFDALDIEVDTGWVKEYSVDVDLELKKK